VRNGDLDVARAAVAAMGFGISFYGFFAAAAAWLVVYFLWAFNAARRDRRRGMRGN